MDPVITRAMVVLDAGGVVGVPTDTVYGIGADPFKEAAVTRLFEVKGRSALKAIAILAADTDQAGTVARLTPEARELADRHWPGPLTLVLRRVQGAPDWLGDPERNTVGVRVPDHPAALALLRATGPLAVTSANRSGDPPVPGPDEAEAILGDLVAFYVPGTSGGGESSTVVDVTGPEARVLRRGPVAWP
jgi:tRNA threonylcarbamoyl adenosine modification protein (Sua5/YciO/YrdC/YwlC family)